ncbi:MAG TPA: transaldolase [Candidatus Levilactobacillus faecigallinarum]|uniref:Transaldolase n=1 Tax=Candidatus Levilactobacillus faecigallinarum TaxID=2838638 RepID=A0A9D1U4C3_9LACO|nr:transaldolase [Candidatus Levilactobacillus faecigallinarum]
MQLNVKVYSDGAELAAMKQVAEAGLVQGFTTNPSLMKAAGITDYLAFAKEAVATFPDQSISFEVFANQPDQMLQEALVLAKLGKHVAVKVPIIRATGEDNTDVIQRLSQAGVRVNVTAITTLTQVRLAVAALDPAVGGIVSVFAGRVADTGVDPLPLMRQSADLCHTKQNVDLLWASTREVFNIVQADQTGCDIITVPPKILTKLPKFGKDALQVSIDTVKTFDADIAELGFTIPTTPESTQTI